MQVSNTSLLKRVFLMLLMLVLMVLSMPSNLSAYAEGDGIPNNAPVYQDSDSSSSISKPDANDVFGESPITVDSTGWSDGLNSILQKIVAFCLNLAVYVFSSFLLIHFVADALIMAFPVVGMFLSTKMPFQIFSNEAARLANVRFSPKKGNGQGGVGGAGDGGAGGVGGAGDNKDATFLSKFKTYAKERGLTVIICGVLIVATYTGVLTWLINLAINFIIGLIVK
jgi:hypothetical protein